MATKMDIQALILTKHCPLDGGKTYKITLPAPIPVGQFWSFTVYDNQTRPRGSFLHAQLSAFLAPTGTLILLIFLAVDQGVFVLLHYRTDGLLHRLLKS